MHLCVRLLCCRQETALRLWPQNEALTSFLALFLEKKYSNISVKAEDEFSNTWSLSETFLPLEMSAGDKGTFKKSLKGNQNVFMGKYVWTSPE